MDGEQIACARANPFMKMRTQKARLLAVLQFLPGFRLGALTGDSSFPKHVISNENRWSLTKEARYADQWLSLHTYMPPMVTVAQVRSAKAGVPSAGPVAALM